MKGRRLALIHRPPLAIVLAALLGATGFAATTAAADGGDHRVLPDVARALDHGPTPVIVNLRPPIAKSLDPEQRRTAVRRAAAASLDRARALERRGVLQRLRPFDLTPAFAAVLTADGLAPLLEDPDVIAIERDDVWPVSTAEGLNIIGADELWRSGITGDGTAVAIIDTGVDPFHPTLGGAAVPNQKIVRGLDTADGDDDPTDCFGHGTAVASIAVGGTHQWSPYKTFEGGVAPEARLLAYKAAPDGACSGLIESAVIAAIEDALLHREGPDWALAAISISAGGPPQPDTCDALDPAMAAVVKQANRLGITVVTSSGNDGDRAGISSPACLSGTLSVGSVWDTDPIPGAATFCLDGACDRTCSDDGGFAGAMTCYTNAGPVLDVLAPSEYLKAAEAGGLTTAFGGTSGAAPYVAGAVALLRDLYPQATSAEIRARLVLKSRAVQAGDPELVRPLIQVHRALDPSDLAVGETPIPVTTPGQPTVVRSTARVLDGGRVGGLRVWLRVAHSEPEVVSIVLRAPDGSTVILRESNSPDPTAGELRPHVIAGTYPVDLRPEESLGRLSGIERQGTWVLEAQAATGAPPVIDAWALHVEDEETVIEDSERFLIPIAARTPGADASLWRTHLQLVNPTARPMEVGLTTGPLSEVAPRRTSLVVPAGHRIALSDAFHALGLNRGSSTLVVDASRDVATAALIVAETTGVRQALPVLEPDTASQVVATHHLFFLDGEATGRSNVGVTDTAGQGGIATFLFTDAHSGEPVGDPVPLLIPPDGVATVTDVHAAAGIAPGLELRGVVSLSDPGLWPWASVVDDTSSDAIFVAGQPLTALARRTLPVVSRGIGRTGELWTTDLRLLSEDEGTIHARFLPADGSSGVDAHIAVSAGATVILDDLVASLFGLASATGALILEPEDPELAWAAEARIRSLRADRRTGQTLPTVATPARGALLVPWLGDGTDTRSNLVITETAGAQLTLSATVLDAQGRIAGSAFSVELDGGAIRILDPLVAADAQGCADCSILLTPTGGAGRFTALASVLDLVTGDPVTIAGWDLSSQ
jgi:subtilisin family serine protease